MIKAAQHKNTDQGGGDGGRERDVPAIIADRFYDALFDEEGMDKSKQEKEDGERQRACVTGPQEPDGEKLEVAAAHRLADIEDQHDEKHEKCERNIPMHSGPAP